MLNYDKEYLLRLIDSMFNVINQCKNENKKQELLQKMGQYYSFVHRLFHQFFALDSDDSPIPKYFDFTVTMTFKICNIFLKNNINIDMDESCKQEYLLELKKQGRFNDSILKRKQEN